MFLIFFHCVLEDLEYNAMIGYAIVISVSTSCSKHCILIDSSILSHVLYCCKYMFFTWFIGIYSINTVLYPYTLPIDHFLHFYSSLCLSCNLCYNLKPLDVKIVDNGLNFYFLLFILFYYVLFFF